MKTQEILGWTPRVSLPEGLDLTPRGLGSRRATDCIQCMNNEGTRAAEDDARSTLDELEGRRVKVKTLRLRGLTQGAMAQALGVDQSTISRDMAWIRNHRKELFGDHSTFDSAQEIGEAVALFADAEVSALRDFSRLQPDQSAARIACLRTAMMARQMRVNLLRDLGFLDGRIGNIGVTLRADVVRQALRDAGLLITDGGHITVGQDDEDDGGRTTATPSRVSPAARHDAWATLAISKREVLVDDGASQSATDTLCGEAPQAQGPRRV